MFSFNKYKKYVQELVDVINSHRRELDAAYSAINHLQDELAKTQAGKSVAKKVATKKAAVKKVAKKKAGK